MRLAEEIQKRTLEAQDEPPDFCKSSHGGVPHKAMHGKLASKGYKLTVPTGPGRGAALYSNPDEGRTVTVHHDGRFIVQKHGEKPKVGQGPDEFDEKMGGK